MLYKTTSTVQWTPETPNATLLNTYSKGFDMDQLEKTAGTKKVKEESWAKVKPKKGKSYMHIITTGAGEHYGPNNNGDFYNEDTCTITVPLPKPGTSKTIVLDGGLNKYHKTYKKIGGVYLEHNNSKKGGPKIGNIHAERYNHKLHRGELIIEVDTEKWKIPLEKLTKNKPIHFSQGSSVRYDICSICGNRSSRPNTYCDHYKKNKLNILDGGHQVFVYNDAPLFHDISLVKTPADMISWGLDKVASTGKLPQIGATLDSSYIPSNVAHELYYGKAKDRSELLMKLASAEKEIENIDVPNMVCPYPEQMDIAKSLEGFDLSDILKHFSRSNMMMPVKTFIKVTTGKDPYTIPGCGSISKILPTIFRSILEEPALRDEFIQDGAYVPEIGPCSDNGIFSVGQNLEEALGMDIQPVRHRVIRISITGDNTGGLDKESSKVTPEAIFLAKEYAKYQLGFIEKNATMSDIRALISSNKKQ